MRIAACQMVSGIDVEKNVRTAKALISSAAQSGAELVVLPEYFALMPESDSQLLEMSEIWENFLSALNWLTSSMTAAVKYTRNCLGKAPRLISTPIP